jgi:two-component system, LytTR family, response regulator
VRERSPSSHVIAVIARDRNSFERQSITRESLFGENRAMINKALSVLEAKLDPAIFFRASRSHIINLQQISGLQPQPDGGLLATLSNGMEISVSRRQSRALRDRLSL